MRLITGNLRRELQLRLQMLLARICILKVGL